MKVFKKLMVMALVLMLIAGIFPARSAQAATKPTKAKVTAKANDDGTSVTLTIAKTKKAQGYQIMVKKPGAKKFVKLTTIKKDGTAARTYTAKKLEAGKYSFKVKAYAKNGNKTVWGAFSKAVTVTVKGGLGDEGESTGSYDFSGAEPGDVITFGSFEQDNKKENGKEPIEWIVLSKSKNELFVLSKYALENWYYNDKIKDVTWETCDLRKWLNEDFYNDAFDKTEKAMIKNTTLKNPNSPSNDIPGGKDTKDNVFLLTYFDATNPEYGFEENANAYDTKRMCAPTERAKADGAYSNEEYLTEDGKAAGQWWLRTPGNTAHNAMIASYYGSLGPYGYQVSNAAGVRPAIIIKLN